MSDILNLAGYKFISLSDLQELREQFKLQGIKFQIKGTILIAPEGINIMAAGSPSTIENFMAWVNSDVRFKDLEFKKSYSKTIPFKRLLVKIKKEIITFSVPGIAPEKFTAPKISPQKFKQWLDEKKEVIILDTRNQCEIEIGKFMGAIDVGINNFRDFPAAAKKIPATLKQKPVVTYCTGGIRCEKAAAHLMQLGFQEVYQLAGGILKYFEECGGEYYQGKCFVFDDRITLDEKLK